MQIDWRAVLTGFVVSLAIGIVLTLVYPATWATVWLLVLPGLVGGLVAGYMVPGAGYGAVHGGLSTVIGSLVLLAFFAVGSILFVGLLPAFAGASLALLSLFVQAIPGALAGALGGWTSGRRAPGPATT